VLLENDRRQRERLYKSLKLIVMKLVASKCNFLCQKCAKTHLRAFVTSKIEGKEGKRWEGRGGEGREGREGEREEREGKGGEGGEREKSTPPPANPRSATAGRPFER
jgi:hypothetical protein